MKKMLVFLILIMICSVNVFATSTYIDQETGTEITLPENWSEVPLLKERKYLDAKFMNSDKTGIVTYSRCDIATEVFSKTEAEELRKYLNMSIMSIEDAKEILGEEGYTSIEKVTYNDVEYFKAELTTTHTLNGQEYAVEQLQFIHFNNAGPIILQLTKQHILSVMMILSLLLKVLNTHTPKNLILIT